MQSARFNTLHLILLLVMLLSFVPRVQATVDWEIQKTLKIESIPLDLAVSVSRDRDGMTLFVLTADGRILIYDRNGNLTDTISVGPHVDQIRVDPLGRKLFAVSRQNKTVKIITFDFIRPINTFGAPFKGPEKAAVAIVVFSDFQ